MCMLLHPRCRHRLSRIQQARISFCWTRRSSQKPERSFQRIQILNENLPNGMVVYGDRLLKPRMERVVERLKGTAEDSDRPIIVWNWIWKKEWYLFHGPNHGWKAVEGVAAAQVETSCEVEGDKRREGIMAIPSCKYNLATARLFHLPLTKIASRGIPHCKR